MKLRTRLIVTLFLGMFDPATGIPMGLLAGRGYARRNVQLASGDLLYFYTDGCVETENEADEMFGTGRLEALLVSIADAGPSTPARVLQQVGEAVTTFRGTREPFDDATMMAVRIG